MAFSSIFKKASSLLGFGSSSLKPPPLDGEIIYCKNNVCVHPPASLTSDKDEHHHGYLTLRSSHDKTLGPTLILTWIPNVTLRKNTKSIENSPNRSRGTTPKTSPNRRTPRQEFAKPDGYVSTPTTSMTSLSPMDSCMSFGGEFGGPYASRKKKHSMDSINSDLSVTSKEQSIEGVTPDEENKIFGDAKENCTLDAGAETCGVDYVQNNSKVISSASKDKKIGQHVNELYAEKISSINTELNNLTKAVLEDGAGDSVNVQDRLNEEEKLASMLNRHKLHSRSKERTDSSRSVSIEMEGDNIRVVTEELDDDVIGGAIIDTKDQTLEQKNLNKDEDKFESSSTDQEIASLTSTSTDHTDNSPAEMCYSKVINEIRDDLNIANTEQLEPCTHRASSNSASGGSETLKEDSNLESPREQTMDTDSSVDPHNATTANGAPEPGPSVSTIPPHPQSLNLSSISSSLPVDIISSPNAVKTPDISVTHLSSSGSTTTSGPDSEPPSSYSSSPEQSSEPVEAELAPDTPSSPDSLSHNLQFPENSLLKGKGDKEKKSAKEQVCGVFSVDLGQMRSLRVFYSDPENTTGQIVIASRESQYKILHFHHGGLDKLAEIFQDWSLFATNQEKVVSEGEKNYKQFMIVKPQLTDDQCHPEEGVYSMVNEDIWRTHMMDDGVIEDDFQLRKAIFFGGLDPCLRHEAWPFLLQYFPFDSTFEEREQIRNDKYIEYQNIRKKRESMSEEELEQFWRSVQCTVEKDVVRTDRSHPYFRGENNPNLIVLKNILLNYAVANPKFGYTQGMSDLLAPVLAEVQNEVDSYWCFEGLMQKTIFVSSPKDCDMDKQLNYLRELLRLMQPTFYEHLNHLGDDALELLFTHRWILLCFKREFNEKAALRIWEACWSHYQTDYFHLFICVAIVAIYGEDVVEQCLPADEILLHFSSLACHMSGEVVLRKARGLLHDYRRRPVIPCTLHGLCSLCGQGMWDSGHVPTVKCVGSHLHGECPYLSPNNTPD